MEQADGADKYENGHRMRREIAGREGGRGRIREGERGRVVERVSGDGEWSGRVDAHKS